jgi:hypothetical protein
MASIADLLHQLSVGAVPTQLNQAGETSNRRASSASTIGRP